MADKETGLNISVNAEANEASAAKAAKDLEKKVNNSVKGGRITVPVDITVPIDEDKKKLTRAQSEIVKKINKLTSKGFSASGEDIADLKSKFKNFTKELDQAGKGRQNKVFREIQKQVETLKKQYKELQQSSKVSSTKNDAKLKEQKTHNKSDDLTEEINDAIKKDYKRKGYDKFSKALGKGASRAKASTPGAPTNLGVRTPTMGGAYVTERSLRMSEISPYRNIDEVRKAKELAKIKKEEKASLTSHRATAEEIEGSKRRIKQREAAGRSQSGTDYELIKKALLTDVAKIQGGLIHGRSDATSQKLIDQVLANLTYDEQQGIDPLKSVMGIHNMLQHRYDTSGKIGTTDGTIKGEGKNQKEANETLSHIYKILDNFIKARQTIFTTVSSISSIKRNSYQDELDRIQSSEQMRILKEVLSPVVNNSGDIDKLQATAKEIENKVDATNKATETQTNYDKIEYSAERVADSAEAKKNADIASGIQKDLETGFNTDAKADTLIDAVREKKEGAKTSKTKFNTAGPIEVSSPSDSILTIISANVKAILKVLGGTPVSETTKKRYAKKKDPQEEKDIFHMRSARDRMLPMVLKTALAPVGEQALTVVKNALVPIEGTFKNYYEGKDLVKNQKRQRIIEKEQTEEKYKDSYTKLAENLPDQSKIVKVFSNVIKDAFSSGSAVDKIMAATAEEQSKMRAERIKQYGLNRGRDLTDTGDIASIRRTKEMFGWTYNSDKNNKNLFQNVKLTPHEDVNTDEIMSSLNKVLSGPEMFKAQTGGALRNFVGSFTGYLGMPSLEKSRAEAEGLNQVMANVRNEVMKLLQEIQSKEFTLHGMEDNGEAKFTSEGYITDDSSSASKKLFADLEEQKGVLRGVLAEVSMVDQVVEHTGGSVHKILQNLGFVMPELMQNNTIIKNINAGLDKSGKALKFQTRTAEVLSYSFQLMARHIGQIIKNWMMMLNPINLIKKAFSDFASYDVKWQRTMNVIKYNLRRIIRPMMEWIAQQLVNILGLVNALVKGIGSALGKDWDLFDQSAANAEKMREELEAAANVTAGFDELHDIGSDNSAAGDLMGDIYTPQWEGLNDFLEGIGETIGHIIDTVSHWNFWNWLALAGAALVGFLALKWLIGLFTGGSNPLQTIAKGFSFLEKAVGWALLIWAFTAFTKALTDFVECMKTASWEDIKRSLTMLGGAIAEIVVAFVLLQAATKFLGGGNWLNSLGIAAIVTSFALLTAAFAYFFDTVKSMSSDQLMTALSALAIGLALVGAAVIALLIALTAIISTGVGAVAIVALAAILAAIAAVIAAMALFVTAVGTYSDQLIAVIQAVGETITSIIQAIANGISLVISTVVVGIVLTIQTIGNTIVNIIMGIAEGIQAVLEPILDFIDDIIEKIIGLAETIAHEIGETIRTIIETVGKIITDIIDSVVNAVPRLLNAILNFCNKIGPAIENSANAIMRTITRVINFTVSAIEYLVNLVVSGVNQMISAINSVSKYVGINIPRVPEVSIPRFVPKYEKGTNYVPNDGLAYLHQGEAVIPKKYNQPYKQGLSMEEQLYMKQMMNTMRSLDDTMKQGITVNGQFIQRGSDLVAVVNKTKSQTGADLLSNVAYAR